MDWFVRSKFLRWPLALAVPAPLILLLLVLARPTALSAAALAPGLLSQPSQAPPPTVAVEEPLPSTLVAPEEPLPQTPQALEPLPLEDKKEARKETEVEAELLQTVSRWAQAWREKRAEDYLSLYSPRLTLTPETSREAWEAERRRRILTPAFISIVVEEPKVRFLTPEEAQVDFIQRYRSDRYQDSVRKSLTLHLEGEVWRIRSEQSEPLAGSNP
jgi:hypothetical protein